MAQTLDHIDLPHPGSVPAQPMPVVRRIALSDAVDALKEGWADFQAVPTQLVFLGLIYPVVGFIAARTATGDLLPLLFPLIAGLSLMGPILAVGTYELSRRLEAGLPVSAANMLDVFRSRGIAGLIAMAGLLLGIFAAWVLVARAIFVVTVGRGVPGSIGEMLQTVMQSDQGRVLLLAGNLTGAAFAVAVLAISVVSLPLLLDRGGSPVAAVAVSLRAVARNPVPMAVWGLMVAGLLLLGSLPFFVGLAVVMPVLGHATWRLYRRVIA